MAIYTGSREYILGTLSECLFFFGIYSFHSGGLREGKHCLPIFGGGNATLYPFVKEKKHGALSAETFLQSLRRVDPIPCCPGFIKSLQGVAETRAPVRMFLGVVPAPPVPSCARRIPTPMRTAILPGIHLNPSDFRS